MREEGRQDAWLIWQEGLREKYSSSPKTTPPGLSCALFQEASALGCIYADYELGICHLYGAHHVERDEDLALVYFAKVCDSEKFPPAFFQLGRMMYEKDQRKQALSLFQRGAALGCTKSYSMLAQKSKLLRMDPSVSFISGFRWYCFSECMRRPDVFGRSDQFRDTIWQFMFTKAKVVESSSARGKKFQFGALWFDYFEIGLVGLSLTDSCAKKWATVVSCVTFFVERYEDYVLSALTWIWAAKQLRVNLGRDLVQLIARRIVDDARRGIE